MGVSDRGEEAGTVAAFLDRLLLIAYCGCCATSVLNRTSEVGPPAVALPRTLAQPTRTVT